MRKRIAVGIRILIAASVGIALPVVSHAQPSTESERSCRSPDALHRKLRAESRRPRAAVATQIRSQQRADPAQPVVTVPRGSTATFSGVIAGGRTGVLVTGRARRPLTGS